MQIPMEIKIAENGKRFVAYLIDMMPIVLVLFLLFYNFFGFDETLNAYFSHKDDLDARIQFLIERNIIRNIALGIWIIYGTFMDCTSFQGTFGKYIMKIRVADYEGNPISLKQSAIRNFSKFISIVPLFIGVIWILFDKQHRAWHDKIAKTIIVE